MLVPNKTIGFVRIWSFDFQISISSISQRRNLDIEGAVIVLINICHCQLRVPISRVLPWTFTLGRQGAAVDNRLVEELHLMDIKIRVRIHGPCVSGSEWWVAWSAVFKQMQRKLCLWLELHLWSKIFGWTVAQYLWKLDVHQWNVCRRQRAILQQERKESSSYNSLGTRMSRYNSNSRIQRYDQATYQPLAYMNCRISRAYWPP